MSLRYKVAPLSNPKHDLCPTLLLLHGRGSDENDLLGLLPLFDTRMLIISVRAPNKFNYGGYTWFDLDANGNINIDELLKSCDLFNECLNSLQSKYQIDPQRLFLFGFSMGAMMSLTISLLNPERYMGIVAHSGLLPQHKNLSYQWNNLNKTSFFIAHGTHDPVVSIEFSRQAYQKLLSVNANCTYREYPISHSISEESISDIADWLEKLI